MLAIAVGFALALPLTAGARSLARRIGQLDDPGGHKHHRRSLPVAGGMAVFWAVALPLVAALAASGCGSELPLDLGVFHGQTPAVLTLLAGADQPPWSGLRRLLEDLAKTEVLSDGNARVYLVSISL